MQRENDLGQGRQDGPTFSEKRQLHEAGRILAALPGAERQEGAQLPREAHTWLVETENSEAPSYSNTL